MSANDIKSEEGKTKEERISGNAAPPKSEVGIAIAAEKELVQVTEQESAGIEQHDGQEPGASEKEHDALDMVSAEQEQPGASKQDSAEQEQPGASRQDSAEQEQSEAPEQESVEKQQADGQEPGAAEKQHDALDTVTAEQEQPGASKQESAEQEQPKKRVKVRLIPIWLRLVIIFLLLVFSLTAGTMVGYGVIGDGNPFDVLKQSTWTHIVDLINKQ